MQMNNGDKGEIPQRVALDRNQLKQTIDAVNQPKVVKSSGQ